jgi:chemotaxis protein methyltransferase CheR
VTPHEYDYLCKLLRQRSGLVLTPEKQYLVETRLLPLARRSGLDSLSELIWSLKGVDAESWITEVVEAMTTNETQFFRDKFPFACFRDVMLPALMTARAAQRRLRIWCAGSATGQEPYSLAMCLEEIGGALANWRIDILATDLSADVLETARNGVYSQFEVQRGLPIGLLLKYFTKVDAYWQIAPRLRSRVEFQRVNLVDDFSALGSFDIVFCRNVLIYFDERSKIDILDRVARVVAGDGYLVLGSIEGVAGLTDRFTPLADHCGMFTANRAEQWRQETKREEKQEARQVARGGPRLAVVGGR